MFYINIFYSFSFSSVFITFKSYLSVTPLLLFQSYFPLMGYCLMIIFEPDEVFSVSPVRGQNILSGILLSIRVIFVYIPVSKAVNGQTSEPAATDFTDRLNNSFYILKIRNSLCILAEELFIWDPLGDGGAFIDKACVAVLAAAFSFLEESSLFISAKYYYCFYIICQIFKLDASICFYGSVTHHCTSEFEVRHLESYMLSICKFNIIGSS